MLDLGTKNKERQLQTSTQPIYPSMARMIRPHLKWIVAERHEESSLGKAEKKGFCVDFIVLFMKS